jgi:hypothetical protein
MLLFVARVLEGAVVILAKILVFLAGFILAAFSTVWFEPSARFTAHDVRKKPPNKECQDDEQEYDL